MRHQYLMDFTYKKPNILQHETTKLISGNEIPVSLLEKMYDNQTYSNSLAVVIGY